MTIRVTSLASGSSGNALLIQSAQAALLVDCGLPQRAIERYLRHAGLCPGDLAAILLTHEHGDHVLSAAPFARRYGVPLVANRPTADALGLLREGVAFQILPTGAMAEIAGFAVASFAVPHDAADPVGYTIRTGGWCVGVALDLGSWDDAVLAALAPADLVVIESNHDRERLLAAPYSWPIKQRIFGPRGAHLGERPARRAARTIHRHMTSVVLSSLPDQCEGESPAFGGCLQFGLYSSPQTEDLTLDCYASNRPMPVAPECSP